MKMTGINYPDHITVELFATSHFLVGKWRVLDLND